MASLVLNDYDYGESKLSFIPQFKKDEFIYVIMYEYNEPGEPVKTTEHGSMFDYDDVVLLRDYLSNVIDLYDQKKKEKSENEKDDK